MDKERLTSLDAFRGLTIAAMILVNNPGDWGHVYWPLDHAPWHGWTPTDLIFPFFLFIVGMALPFSHRTSVGQRCGGRWCWPASGSSWPPTPTSTSRACAYPAC